MTQSVRLPTVVRARPAEPGGAARLTAGGRQTQETGTFVGLRVPRLLHVAGIRRLSKLAVGHWNREREDGKERD